MGKLTVSDLARFKKDGRKIAAITAYDVPFARIMDKAGVDIILVGDSVGMAVHGRPDTLSVTMDEMILHGRSASSAVKTAFVAIDMPYGSVRVSKEKAVENALRFIGETGAQAVKVEGGLSMAPVIKAMVDAGVPVWGHVGLMPQSINELGGYKVQGRDEDSARGIVADALAIQEAGAFMMLLEAIPADLGQKVTETLAIPTIGIGAGPHCDGQILVMHDMLGLSDGPLPRFVKVYADLGEQALAAVRKYADEVRRNVFPDDARSYHSKKPDK